MTTRRPIAACGTEPGVKAHRRRGESACRACLDAKNAANRARYAGRPAGVTIRRIFEVECRTCDVIVAASRTRAIAEQDRRDHLARFHGGAS